MGFTVPLFVPFTKGLDLSKEAILGSNDLVQADNVDYGVEGAVQGRPGRAAPAQFAVSGFVNAASNGNAAQGYGGGGAVALAVSRTGGAGAPGVVIIEEYG